MQKSKRNRISPVHRKDFQQRMHISPVLHCHQYTIIVLTLIERSHIIKIKIHNMYLGMIFPQIIPQKIHIMAPVPAHEHQIFSIQILHRQTVFLRQAVMDGNRAADRLPGNLQSFALTEIQHRLIKNSGDHINVLSQISKDLPRIFRCVVERDQLKLNVRTVSLQLRSQSLCSIE